MAERALEAMKERVKSRTAFGRLLAEQDTVIASIAESRMEIEQARYCVCVCLSVRQCVCMSVCVYVCLHAHMHTCVCTHTYIHKGIHAYIHIHLRAHTYAHAQ